MPLLDLSVVTWNSAKWIAGFFDSLLLQDYPLHRINVLLRDGGSNDDTVERCHEIATRYGDRFMGFCITQGDNPGFGQDHNHNLPLGTAPFFLVTNVDLEFAPDAICRAVKAAAADDGMAASWEFRQKPYEHPKYYNPVTLETNWSSSACILFLRSALEDVGGYEKRIFKYGEDVELSYRLRDHGYKLKYCPKAVCWHYSYEHTNQLKPVQFFGSTLANIYIRLRYGSARDILCGLLMYLGLWLYAPAFPGRWRGLFRNGVQILRNAPFFLATRKKSQESFPFRSWDYEVRREGAFYPYLKSLPDQLPLVSVVMRTYQGRLPWLREAIASVANQTYPNIELVVVEDGSDAACDFVNQLAQSGKLSSVKYLSLPKQGRCLTGNAGLAAASGEFLAFLDDDDLFFADHLEVLVGELRANPNLAGVYALAFEVPTSVQSINPLEYKEKRQEVVWRQRFSRPILWHHNYISIQSMVFRRTLYDTYGGFDANLENLEDWNLWTRYSLQEDFRLVEKVTSLYRVPADTAQIIRRQKSLDTYYARAAEKQREMRISLSPADVMAYSQELSRNINAIVIPYLRIRNFLIRNKWLNVFYYLAVRIVNKRR